MDTLTQIYTFYLFLILVPSIIIYWISQPDNKMIYSLVTAIGGAILSIILWFSYGKSMVEGQSQ